VNSARLGDVADSLPCSYGDDLVADAPSFNVVKVSNIGGDGQFHGSFESRHFKKDQLPDLLVNEGELLVVKSSGSKANILSGKTAICGFELARRIVASNFLLRLRVDESRAIPRFIWYVLNSSASKAYVKTIVGASTYPNLKWSLYSSLPIPLPPLAEQRRIAEILDEVGVLRAKRRASLVQLDTLTQSTFLDTVAEGSTVANQTLDSVCERITDGTHYTPTYSETGVVFLSSRNVKSGYIDWEDVKYIPDQLHLELHRRVAPRPNDILLAKNGTTGVAALVDRDCIFDIYVSLALLRPSDRVLPIFLREAINSPPSTRQFNASLKGIGVPNLHEKEIRKTLIPIPPIDVQRDFVSRIEAIEKNRNQQRVSLKNLDALFASLQYRAFRGEL
jgi:type I restriction enzyme S subunit